MPISIEEANAVLAHIHIGNVHRPETHVGILHYCGRQMPGHSSYVKSSALCNRHKTGSCRACHGREIHISPASTLPFFEVDFTRSVQGGDPAIMAELRAIWKRAAAGDDVTLLCRCAPAPCHTQIIRQMLHDLATGKIKAEPYALDGATTSAWRDVCARAIAIRPGARAALDRETTAKLAGDRIVVFAPSAARAEIINTFRSELETAASAILGRPAALTIHVCRPGERRRSPQPAPP